jgi:ATP-binding cassette subfamily F protein 3
MQEQPTALKNEWIRQKEEKANQRKQQKRLETVEAEIESSERRMKEIDILLETPEVFSDHVRCQELHDEHEGLKKTVDALYEEWDTLNDVLS